MPDPLWQDNVDRRFTSFVVNDDTILAGGHPDLQEDCAVPGRDRCDRWSRPMDRPAAINPRQRRRFDQSRRSNLRHDGEWPTALLQTDSLEDSNLEKIEQHRVTLLRRMSGLGRTNASKRFRKSRAKLPRLTLVDCYLCPLVCSAHGSLRLRMVVKSMHVPRSLKCRLLSSRSVLFLAGTLWSPALPRSRATATPGSRLAD